MTPRIVLIGPSGAGRTTVGQALAREWQMPLTEGEDLLGEPVSEAFLRDHVAAKQRVIETSLQALDETDGILTLLPSGAIAPEVMATMNSRNIPVVALSCATAELARRSNLNAARSQSLGTPRALFAAQVRAFHEGIVGLSAETIDTSESTPEAIAAEINSRFTIQ